MEFQELGEQKARNGSSSVGSSGSKGMSVVWENEVGDEADRWRLQRGLGATVLPVVLHHKIFPFFFFWCFLSLRSEPSTHKENRSVWEEEDRGRQSCDRSVLSL